VALLLLLACPPLFDPGWHAHALQLCALLSSLPAELGCVATLVLQTLPPAQLRSLLQHLNGFLIARCYEHLDRPAGLQRAAGGCLQVLAWLHEANEASSPAPLEQAEFHNDALNCEDWTQGRALPGGGGAPSRLREDYDAWAGSPGGGGGFSFCRFPFVYTPATKARILSAESSGQQHSAFQSAMVRSMFDAQACPFCVLKVRREHIVSDATREIRRRRGHLHKPLKVVFLGEEGVDEGGPQREFFSLVTRALFTPDYGMFRPQDEDEAQGAASQAARLLWFAPGGVQSVGEEAYEFCGTLLGMAIYNGVLLELSFPTLVYKLLQGGVPVFDDLREVSPATHASLQKLLTHPPERVEAELGLVFAADYEHLGERHSDELKPGGRDVAVTGESVREYVALYADWLLSRSVRREFAAFRKGFARLVSGPAVRLFRPDELEQLLCGSRVLDFALLEAACSYADGMGKGDTLARSFWRVAHALEEGQKKFLLAFVTGSDRVPIGGLGTLPFKLQRNGDGDERLPTSVRLLLSECVFSDASVSSRSKRASTRCCCRSTPATRCCATACCWRWPTPRASAFDDRALPPRIDNVARCAR
jgi:hypothetical protein